MNDIIFTAHGLSATAMEDSVAMVLGERDNFYTLALTHDQGIDAFRRQLALLVARLRRDAARGILILTDMPAGTPYNVSVQLALAGENMDVLSGTNFPMVLTALDQSDLPLSDLTELVMETGREAINRFVAVAYTPEDF
ncbi:PTS sugar transporter subunit IIA [Acerihabitans sp. KWT182]|uniref:PTS sugar transporter subunit IIA n=1 Tax=Acerihabitans sp. KWT182 TaxID=3157919 RepID=A0AAU7QEK1_9GAMM